jgi:hypothetical protein
MMSLTAAVFRSEEADTGQAVRKEGSSKHFIKEQNDVQV